jgi:hypothetical protein
MIRELKKREVNLDNKEGSRQTDFRSLSQQLVERYVKLAISSRSARDRRRLPMIEANWARQPRSYPVTPRSEPWQHSK